MKETEGKRTEQVGAKVTLLTKERINNFKRETGQSLGDVIEIVYMNFSMELDERVLFKVENIEEQINLLKGFAEKTQKITEETLSIIKSKEDILNTAKKQIKKNEEMSTENKLKKSLKSFVEIRKQHLDSFGNLKYHFDVENAKRKICELNRVDQNDFSKLLTLVDDGEDLEYILSHDLCEFGIEL